LQITGDLLLVIGLSPLGALGFSVQVSGVSRQMTEDRKQKSNKAFHLPGFFVSIFCHLTSAPCRLFIPDT
jgi:hypothetical protein